MWLDRSFPWQVWPAAPPLQRAWTSPKPLRFRRRRRLNPHLLRPHLLRPLRLRRLNPRLYPFLQPVRNLSQPAIRFLFPPARLRCRVFPRLSQLSPNSTSKAKSRWPRPLRMPSPVRSVPYWSERTNNPYRPPPPLLNPLNPPQNLKRWKRSPSLSAPQNTSSPLMKTGAER